MLKFRVEESWLLTATELSTWRPLAEICVLGLDRSHLKKSSMVFSISGVRFSTWEGSRQRLMAAALLTAAAVNRDFIS